MSEVANERPALDAAHTSRGSVLASRPPDRGWSSVAASLVVPIAWGLAAYFLLSAAIESRYIDSELARRYLLGHPVSKTTTAMFCVGLAALLGTVLDVIGQIRQQRKISLEHVDVAIPETEVENDLTADQRLSLRLLDHLRSLPRALQQNWLTERLAAALGYIHRNGATEAMESELKYLAESDQIRQQQRYSLVRILIWATPMLGFLGTVMGISEALGSLNVGPENDLQKMMGGLQSSLYVAFDTTAQALVFSIAMMFITFICERFESQWLASIDRQTSQTIAHYFEFVTPANEASQTVYRLGRRMVAATRAAVSEHTEIWRQTITAAEQAWQGTQWQLSTEMQTQWSQAIRESLNAWTEAIDHSTAEADERMALRWAQWQTTLSEFARSLEDRQRLANQQSSTVNEILGRLENLGSIHQAINQNLESLHSTARLETALTGLTQVIGQLRWELGQNRLEHMTSNSVPVSHAGAEGSLDVSSQNSDVAFSTTPGVSSGPVSESGSANEELSAHDEPVILQLPSIAERWSTPQVSAAKSAKPQVIRLTNGAQRAA